MKKTCHKDNAFSDNLILINTIKFVSYAKKL